MTTISPNVGIRAGAIRGVGVLAAVGTKVPTDMKTLKACTIVDETESNVTDYSLYSAIHNVKSER